MVWSLRLQAPHQREPMLPCYLQIGPALKFPLLCSASLQAKAPRPPGLRFALLWSPAEGARGRQQGRRGQRRNGPRRRRQQTERLWAALHVSDGPPGAAAHQGRHSGGNGCAVLQGRAPVHSWRSSSASLRSKQPPLSAVSCTDSLLSLPLVSQAVSAANFDVARLLPEDLGAIHPAAHLGMLRCVGAGALTSLPALGTQPLQVRRGNVTQGGEVEGGQTEKGRERQTDR